MTKNILAHIFVFFFIKLPVQLAGIPVLAVALLFVPRDKEYLPWYLRWWDNHERYFEGNSSDDGLSGPDYIRNKFKDPTGWWARFNWLALRNPANYFQYAILGRQRHEYYERLVVKGCVVRFNHANGVDNVLNIGTHNWNNRGWYYQEVLNGDELLWEFYMVYPIFKDWHFRLRAGWKIGGHYSDNKTGDQLQWVLAVTPLKKLD